MGTLRARLTRKVIVRDECGAIVAPSGEPRYPVDASSAAVEPLMSTVVKWPRGLFIESRAQLVGANALFCPVPRVDDQVRLGVGQRVRGGVGGRHREGGRPARADRRREAGRKIGAELRVLALVDDGLGPPAAVCFRGHNPALDAEL